MLADNFWFSLEVAGCQKTDQQTRTGLPKVVSTKHPLCTVQAMPQTVSQLEDQTQKHIKAN